VALVFSFTLSDLRTLDAGELLFWHKQAERAAGADKPHPGAGQE